MLTRSLTGRLATNGLSAQSAALAAGAVLAGSGALSFASSPLCMLAAEGKIYTNMPRSVRSVFGTRNLLVTVTRWRVPPSPSLPRPDSCPQCDVFVPAAARQVVQ